MAGDCGHHVHLGPGARGHRFCPLVPRRFLKGNRSYGACGAEQLSERVPGVPERPRRGRGCWGILRFLFWLECWTINTNEHGVHGFPTDSPVVGMTALAESLDLARSVTKMAELTDLPDSMFGPGMTRNTHYWCCVGK